jgi:glycosyltransferase involved in cell wall biosynthesis
MTINIHIYPSPFRNESRILKITQTLRDVRMFDKIFILGTWEAPLPEREVLDETREVIRIPRKWGMEGAGTFWKALKTFEWSWRIARFFKGRDIACINCHSLPVLPLCAYLKVVHRAKLIYDTHELETETVGMGRVRKLLSKLIERVFIGFVDATVVVCDAIADWYKKAYPKQRVWSVRNMPYKLEVVPKPTALLRSRFEIGPEDTLFLYQGVLGKGRGIEILLDAFSRSRPDQHIVFMGYGELAPLVEKRAVECVSIHFHPAVRPDEILSYTADADVGISLIEDLCLSYRYCLPNKLFEYLDCGLPVVVSRLPEMTKVVETYDCGWIITISRNELVALLAALSPEKIAEKKAGALRARQNFGWQFEEPILLDVYKTISLMEHP